MCIFFSSALWTLVEMPKNTGKGGKSRRKGARNAAGPRPLPVKTGAGEEYAQCLRMLGANRLEARCGCVLVP